MIDEIIVARALIARQFQDELALGWDGNSTALKLLIRQFHAIEDLLLGMHVLYVGGSNDCEVKSFGSHEVWLTFWMYYTCPF